MDDEEKAEPDAVAHADVTIEEVEAFIDELPNEYRFLAIFVYATAAPPEAAISLEVGAVKRLFAKLGSSRAMQRLSNISSHPDWDLLLPVYIAGRRTELLKRKGIQASDEPPQVYLDRTARPFTLEKVNGAFLRLSRELNLPIPVSLETIARVVATQSMMKLMAMPQHPASVSQHYWSLSGRLEYEREGHA
ncbi:hypothetical protein [Rhizobium leguminosarum]|uniref:hypothetical protein n=1 Tax=Rhizobium leguminosarum TaxID=384 RepID=UPI00103A8769|nr:hypothetical protein [Rhizobium leguminosarum]TCA57158.1 hypothetical protein E0H41_26505 [Rhizobium leguminosarum bv. viciae]TCB22077.1 hypothetical protein E0J09_25845 [Rhizobium leguminosarum bv. viciae]